MAVGSYNYTISPFSTSQLQLFRPQRRQGSNPTTATPCSCCCCPHQLSPSPVINTTLSEIKNSGVIACLRAQSAELAMEAACAALRGGISVLEIVTSTPGVFEVLQQLVKDHPTKTFGVGTVLNAKDAKRAINAGAKFLMSPAMVKDILDNAQGSETLYIPGVMTPTEILSAHDAGAKIVKVPIKFGPIRKNKGGDWGGTMRSPLQENYIISLTGIRFLYLVYPVSMLGSVQYLSALRRPFSHISMIASQGITIDLIGDYIAQGASSVVLSDAIFEKEAMDHRRFNLIDQLSQLAVLRGNEAVKRKRSCYLN